MRKLGRFENEIEKKHGGVRREFPCPTDEVDIAFRPADLTKKGARMNLNLEQQKAIENGEPVAVTVAGTQCVLVRRDIFLHLDPDFDTGPWTVEEMNLLADEAEEMISKRESHEP